MLAVKSVRQNYNPSRELLELLHTFRRIVNHSLGIGLANNVSSLKMLSVLAYKELALYDSPSYYKFCAMSRAAGILAARKKSIRRGFAAKSPYAVKLQLASCYGFKIEKGPASNSNWPSHIPRHPVDQAHSLYHIRPLSERSFFHSYRLNRQLDGLERGFRDRLYQYCRSGREPPQPDLW